MKFSLTTDLISAATLQLEFSNSVPDAGACVTFSGMVRPTNRDGLKVKALHIEAYNPLTENGIQRQIAQAKRRWPLLGVQLIHRVGHIPVGETIVFVAAASSHRRAAFEAADFLMDYLKTSAYFWKQEITESGAVWIEPRAEDYKDAQRWSNAL